MDSLLFPIVLLDVFFYFKGPWPLKKKLHILAFNALYCGLVGKCGGRYQFSWYRSATRHYHYSHCYSFVCNSDSDDIFLSGRQRQIGTAENRPQAATNLVAACVKLVPYW
jgi:hypothetical protein